MEYKHLYVNTAVTPRFYSLIKTHKANYPIRPIVSFIDSPTYLVAKFLNRILSPLTFDAPQRLKNSTEAKNVLENVNVPDSHILVSFDVKSLFTSIPIKLALESVEDMIKNNPKLKETTSLNPKSIMNLLNICMEANCFQWNHQIYKQIHGTPMGSPISVVLAEMTMQCIEKRIFENSPVNVQLWKRYVDDVIAIIPKD